MASTSDHTQSNQNTLCFECAQAGLKNLNPVIFSSNNSCKKTANKTNKTNEPSLRTMNRQTHREMDGRPEKDTQMRVDFIRSLCLPWLQLRTNYLPIIHV